MRLVSSTMRVLMLIHAHRWTLKNDLFANVETTGRASHEPINYSKNSMQFWEHDEEVGDHKKVADFDILQKRSHFPQNLVTSRWFSTEGRLKIWAKWASKGFFNCAISQMFSKTTAFEHLMNLYLSWSRFGPTFKRHNATKQIRISW